MNLQKKERNVSITFLKEKKKFSSFAHETYHFESPFLSSQAERNI
jgi:hypothetical protein